MKKILMLGGCLLVLTGCSLGTGMLNTPKKQVESFFSKYQTLDQSVLDDLDKVVAEEELFNTEQRDAYRSLMKKHYQGITYDIKDERVDGDEATVTVEIEVTDYSKTMAEAELYKEQNPNEFQDENGVYNASKFMDYQLEQLKDVKDKVKYTLDLTLKKEGDEWKLNPLSETDEQKLHGTYTY